MNPAIKIFYALPDGPPWTPRHDTEIDESGAQTLMPSSRSGELATYVMRADAATLQRHRDGRRWATLLVRFPEDKSVNNALELSAP
jgi:hypothetical protein